MNINDIRKAHTLSLEELNKLPIHILAFNTFMVREYEGALESSAKEVIDNQASHYGYSAYLGYLLAISNDDTSIVNKFREEVSHLSGRTFFSGGRAARFEIDGIALLGVAVGLYTIDATEDEKKWLIELLHESEKALASNKWDMSFIQSAKAILTDLNWSVIIDNMLRVSIPFALNQTPEATIRQQAWEIASKIEENDSAVRHSVKRAVFDYCAYFIANLPINDVSVTELISLLSNISQSMSHWTYETKTRVKGAPIRQWDIDHEYHVQNLLWTILKPVFPDLVDEESLPKIGHMTPRYDLGIPSLQTIIEVKFMKNSGQSACKKLIEEIAADSSVYLTPKTDYERIIAFVWDNCQQTEEYKVLIDGLKTLSGIEDVIILPRPSRMMATVKGSER